MRVIFKFLLVVLFSIQTSFSTSLAAVENQRVLDISVQQLNGQIAVAITFSSKLKSDVDLDQWLSIETVAGDSVSGSWVLGDKAKTLYFTNIEPETNYNVAVKSGLPMANWTLLTQGMRQSVAVAAITPMLGFAGNGNLLAESLSDGLPVISVNAGSVEVDFYRIPQSLLVDFLTSNTRRGQQDFWEIRSYISSLEHIYTGRFDLQLAPNQTATSYLPISEITPLQERGVYLAIMRKAGEYEYSHPSTWFAISDLGIHLRNYREYAQVNVSSLSTALAKAGVSIELLDSAGKVLDKQVSDESGNVTFSPRQLDKAKILLATQGNQSAILRLFGPKLDLAEFPISGAVNTAQMLFIYAPRDLYRPGEQITISALLRDNDGRSVPSPVLNFILKQPDGRIVSEQRIRPNSLGYYASQWRIAADASTGQWSVSAQIPGQMISSFTLQVEDFLPERMALTLSAAEFVDTKDDYQVAVNGQYLYGAPAAGNTLQSELVTTSSPHPFKEFADFYFNNPQQTQFNRREVLADQTLSAAGELQLTTKNYWREANTVLQLKLYSSLLDSGGRPVSRISNTFALPAKLLVGIRPLFDQDIAPYDGSAMFELILSDGVKKLAAQNLSITLIRERRDYHWRYTESEGWTANYTESHYPVFQSSVDIKAASVATLAVPVDWGYYRLEVKNPETGVISGYRFRAGWSADETVMAGRPDRIGMALDKQRYKVGDTVTVTMKPAAAGRGYLLVESDQVLYRQPIEVSDTGSSVSFEVLPGWDSHDIYVSVLLVQPGAERETQLPRRMLGITHLPLDRQERNLTVSINSPAKIRPNSRLVVAIDVAGQTALDGPIQVTLAAVDVGVLSISKFASPDPFKAFFQQREYSITARDNFSDLISADQGVMAQLKFGGDEDSQSAGEADPDVEIVSLFSGVVDVDTNGQAQVSLDIPNFNGRLRLMAVAFSADSFGADQQDLQVAAPIVAQLSKPRFLRAGDESWLALDLHNLSGQDQQLQLTLKLAQGLHFQGEGDLLVREFSVELAEGAKQVLRFPVVAQANYQMVNIALSMANIVEQGSLSTVDKHWQIEVKPAWPKSEKLWVASLNPAEQFTLEGTEFAEMLSFGLDGQLSVSNQPPLDIASHFKALKAYPYGCLEQTSSGVFPQLYVDDQLLLELGIEGNDANSRKVAIDIAIGRLQSMQRSSGGFGLWSALSPEEYWLTVYVTDFLLRAQQSGYQVPSANLHKALQRIALYLRNPNKIRGDGSNSATKFAVRAYAGQILARQQQAPLSVLRRMYDNRGAGESPMALVQLALALEQAGDKKRAKEGLDEALMEPARFAKPTIYYASAVRDLALSSFWLLEAKHPAERWLPLLHELTQQLTQRQWLSTQERNALFLLGRELHRISGDQIQLAGQVGSVVFENALGQLQRSLDARQLRQPLSIRNDSTASVYLNLRVAGYEKQIPTAVDQGLSIERRFYRLNGEPFGGDTLQSGEKLIVELEIQADQRLPHAMLVDLLPAGLEIENQNLADSYAQSDLQIAGVSLSERMDGLEIKYQEYRDDRFVMALDMSRGKSLVYYLVRAVAPGKYIIPPTFAEDMYRPEIRHNGAAAGSIEIQPRSPGAH